MTSDLHGFCLAAHALVLPGRDSCRCASQGQLPAAIGEALGNLLATSTRKAITDMARALQAALRRFEVRMATRCQTCIHSALLVDYDRGVKAVLVLDLGV